MKHIPLWIRFKLWFYTLFYHSNFSRDYIMDTILEPLFWCVDHFTKIIGNAFVVLVIILIGSVVLIAHFLGLPFYLNKSFNLTLFLIIFGYWILTNIIWNFYMTAAVGPGIPNENELIYNSSPGISLCKKCIRKKPLRTHHCSICNRCYLKMDHHCPWVNNCIGHFNHRYFFLTMVYIVVGCVFIMILGFEIAYRQIIQDDDILPFISYQITDSEREKYEYYKTHKLDAITLEKENEKLPTNENALDNTIEKTHLLFDIPVTRLQLKTLIYFAGVLCIGCAIALGALIYWHSKLISKGETSIEYHINKSERKRVGEKNFVNPYDLGRKKNWKLFLGLDQNDRSFLRHILMPSSHPPLGNGYDWSHFRHID